MRKSLARFSSLRAKLTKEQITATGARFIGTWLSIQRSEYGGGEIYFDCKAIRRDVCASQLRSLNRHRHTLHVTLASAGPGKFSCIVEISPLSVSSKFAISNAGAPSSPPARVPGNCTDTRLELEFKITEAISNDGENSTLLISHGTVTKTVAWAGWDGVSWTGAASKLGQMNANHSQLASAVEREASEEYLMCPRQAEFLPLQNWLAESQGAEPSAS